MKDTWRDNWGETHPILLMISIGQKFGRWTVVGKSERRGDHYWSECRCECGKTKSVEASTLVTGKSVSCGCFRLERLREKLVKHGMSGTLTYVSWSAMILRCKSTTGYFDRGIKVCKRWNKIENFIKDMGLRPSKDYSIERIDNDGNYCKSNCKWATRKEQQNNRTITVFVVVFGERLSVPQAAEKFHIPQGNLRDRIEAGWPTEDAVLRPLRPNKNRKQLSYETN